MSIVTASECSKSVVAQGEPIVTTSYEQEQTALTSSDEHRRPRPYLIEDLPDEDWQAIEREQRALAAQEAASDG